MGVCSSMTDFKANSPKQPYQLPTAFTDATAQLDDVGDASDDFLCRREPCSISASTPRGKTPQLVFANDSIYTVSYSVIQENKLRTTEHTERTANTRNLTFAAGNLGVGVMACLRREMEEITKMEDVWYFRMKDHRMGPLGKTPTTKVVFPPGCDELRVLAYFQNGSGKWQLYKNKVYSAGKSRAKKSFILRALDTNIAPYNTHSNKMPSG